MVEVDKPASKGEQVASVLPKVRRVPVAAVVAALGPKAAQEARAVKEWAYELERCALGTLERTEVKPSDCKHPVTRRMDGHCMVCFAKVSGK